MSENFYCRRMTEAWKMACYQSPCQQICTLDREPGPGVTVTLCPNWTQHLYVAWYCTENTTTEISFDRWASSSFMALANALMRCVAWSATGFWLDRPLTTDRNARERARRSDDLGFHRRLIARTRTLFFNFTDRFKSATTLMFLIDVIPNVLTTFHLTQRLFSLLFCLNYFQNILQVSFFLENIPLRARQCGFRARNDLDINYI